MISWRALVTLGVLLTGCGQEAAEGSDHAAATSGAGAASTPGGAAGRGPGGAGATASGSGGSSGGSGTSSVAGAGGRTEGGASGGGQSGAGYAGAANAGGREPLGGRSGGGDTSGGGNTSGAGPVGGAPVAGRGGASSGGAGAMAGRSSGGAGGNITLWLAGDSTVANGETPCPVGWGKLFDARFDERVTVTNSAVGGRSVHTWLYSVQKVMDDTGECVLDLDSSGDPVLQSRWTAMLNGMKAGDYLFIQFGINDGDASCDRHVGIDAFKESYGMMAAAAKERGAQPIFVTPTSSISCNGSAARGTRGEFVPATLDAGTEFDVPVIDLHALSVALYTSLAFCPLQGGDVSASTTGPVGEFFCDDHTHFDTPGATQIAGLVAQALVDQGIPLAAYLK